MSLHRWEQQEGKQVGDLLEFVTEAHGGRERWSQASAVTATVDFYGGFFDARGQSDLLGPCEFRASLDRQYISVRSAESGHAIVFDGEEDRVVVTARSGEVVEDLKHPRQSMLALAPLGPTTRWTAAQTGHFIGYALWSYLLEPYTFQWPGVATAELEVERGRRVVEAATGDVPRVVVQS